MGLGAPPIVTAWGRAGQLRARCPRPNCLHTDGFPPGSLGAVVCCPHCGGPLRLNPFTMARAPVWDAGGGGSAGGGGLCAEDRTLVEALALGLDHHAALLREHPGAVLQELCNEFRFDAGAAGSHRAYVTLAAAHARRGELERAIAWQSKALDCADHLDKDERKRARLVLRLYRDRKQQADESASRRAPPTAPPGNP